MVVVAIEAEEVGVADPVKAVVKYKVVPNIKVQNTLIFQMETGQGVACTSSGDAGLSSVQNLPHALGRTSFLQSQPNEGQASSRLNIPTLLNQFVTLFTMKTLTKKYIH